MAHEQIYPIGSKLWNREKTKEEKEAAAKELLECFKQLEEELGEKDYFGGQTFGIIDIALIPFYSMFLAFKLLGNLDLEVECPKIFQWVKRCIQRESVSNNMPAQPEVYDIALEFLGLKHRVSSNLEGTNTSQLLLSYTYFHEFIILLQIRLCVNQYYLLSLSCFVMKYIYITCTKALS